MSLFIEQSRPVEKEKDDMPTITMKKISQAINNSGHACTWDATGFASSQERELVIDVGDDRFQIVNDGDETAGFSYGGDRVPIEPALRVGPVSRDSPMSGETVELLLFTNSTADPIPFVTLKLTKKTGG